MLQVNNTGAINFVEFTSVLFPASEEMVAGDFAAAQCEAVNCAERRCSFKISNAISDRQLSDRSPEHLAGKVAAALEGHTRGVGANTGASAGTSPGGASAGASAASVLVDANGDGARCGEARLVRKLSRTELSVAREQSRRGSDASTVASRKASRQLSLDLSANGASVVAMSTCARQASRGPVVRRPSGLKPLQNGGTRGGSHGVNGSTNGHACADNHSGLGHGAARGGGRGGGGSRGGSPLAQSVGEPSDERPAGAARQLQRSFSRSFNLGGSSGGASGSGGAHLSKVGALQSEVRHLGVMLANLDDTVGGLSSRMQAIETMMGEVHAAVVAQGSAARGEAAGEEQDAAANGGLWEALSGSFKKHDEQSRSEPNGHRC